MKRLSDKIAAFTPEEREAFDEARREAAVDMEPWIVKRAILNAALYFLMGFLGACLLALMINGLFE